MNMQGWMKLSGAVCILWGAAGTGIWFAGRYRQRILELEQLKQMVFLLKGQILYAGAPLPEAFGTVGRRVAGTLGNLFQETAALLEAQTSTAANCRTLKSATANIACSPGKNNTAARSSVPVSKAITLHILLQSPR